MKVCFQTKCWGEGAGWFAQELVLGMAKAGVDLIYIAPPAVPFTREPVHARLTRVKSRRELQSGRRSMRIVSSLARIFDGLRACLIGRLQTDTYMFSIPDPIAFFLPLQLILRLLGSRIYLIVHDAVPHSWADGKARPAHRFALYCSYHLATRLVATTHDCRDDLLLQFGVKADQISIIPHGAFDLGVPKPLPGNRRLLIFGTLRRNKGVLQSIRAVQRCRANGLQIQLLIAGAPDSGDRAYWTQCVAEIRKSPDGIDVRLGFVPDNELDALIAHCDAALLAYSNFSSASGVAVLMALSQRPLLATASGGIRELFVAGAAGVMLDDADEDSIVRAIEAFCNRSVEEWQEQVVKSRATILQQLSWDEIGRQYANMLLASDPTDDFAIGPDSRATGEPPH